MEEREVIEAEVIDETGAIITPDGQKREEPRVKVTVFSGIAALAFGFLLSLLMALLAIIIFLPLLIIKQFTRNK